MEQSYQTSALSIAGDALTSNIYLDIPPLLRGLWNSFLCKGAELATRVVLSDEMLKMVRESKPDPKDPTSIVKEYYKPWWTRAAEWKEERPELFDIDAAFDFHWELVSGVPAPVVLIEILKCRVSMAGFVTQNPSPSRAVLPPARRWPRTHANPMYARRNFERLTTKSRR